MQPRLTMLTLGVADLERSVAFYHTGLGFAISPYGTGSHVWFRLQSGLVFAVYHRDLLAEDLKARVRTTAVATVMLTHHVDTEAEVDRVLAMAVAAGGRLIKPAEEDFWCGRVGLFADPDGYGWEVMWNEALPVGSDGSLELPEDRDSLWL